MRLLGKTIPEEIIEDIYIELATQGEFTRQNVISEVRKRITNTTNSKYIADKLLSRWKRSKELYKGSNKNTWKLVQF